MRCCRVIWWAVIVPNDIRGFEGEARETNELIRRSDFIGIAAEVAGKRNDGSALVLNPVFDCGDFIVAVRPIVTLLGIRRAVAERLQDDDVVVTEQVGGDRGPSAVDVHVRVALGVEPLLKGSRAILALHGSKRTCHAKLCDVDASAVAGVVTPWRAAAIHHRNRAPRILDDIVRSAIGGIVTSTAIRRMVPTARRHAGGRGGRATAGRHD